MCVDRLLAQHVRILANVESLQRFSEGPPPAHNDNLADKRWSFTRDLLLHFARMESKVYGPMMNDLRDHAQQAAARASVETSTLVAEFREHVARWHDEQPAAHWDCYGRAITRLMQRIRMRIEEEAAEIVPLLPVQPDGTRGGPTRESYAAEAWEIRGVLFKGIKLPR